MIYHLFYILTFHPAVSPHLPRWEPAMKYLPSHETHELHAAPSTRFGLSKNSGTPKWQTGWIPPNNASNCRLCWGFTKNGPLKYRYFRIIHDDHSCSWSFRYYMLYLHVLSDSKLSKLSTTESLYTKLNQWSNFGAQWKLVKLQNGLGKALKGSSFAPTHSHIGILVEIQQILPKSKNRWQLEGSVGSTAEQPPHQVLPVLRPRLIKGQVERPCKTYLVSCMRLPRVP